MKKVLKNNKGFTLIELIVVLVVLTILMCLTAPSVFGYSRKAQETAAIEECKGVVTAVIDIFSDKYVNTGTRITGDECLIGKGTDPEGRDDPTIVEAKKMAGVDGDVRGAWVRGNNDYILSHLVYEWSDNLWVVYDKGEYKIYKGESNTPADDKKKGIEPSNEPKNPPSNDYNDDGDDDEEGTTSSTMKKPTEASTEAATEGTTQAPTTQAPTTKEEPTSEAATEKEPETPGGGGLILKNASGDHVYPMFETEEKYWDNTKKHLIENPSYETFLFNRGDVLLDPERSILYIIARPSNFGLAYNDSWKPFEENTKLGDYVDQYAPLYEWDQQVAVIPVTSDNIVYEINNGVWLDDIDTKIALRRGDMLKIDGTYYVWNNVTDASWTSIGQVYQNFLNGKYNDSGDFFKVNTRYDLIDNN